MQNDQIVKYAQSFLEAVQQLSQELPSGVGASETANISSTTAGKPSTSGSETSVGTSVGVGMESGEKPTKHITQSKNFQDIGCISPVKSYTLVGRFNPVANGLARSHLGLDFSAPNGTPVYAIYDGVVTYTTTVASGVNELGGNTVTISCVIDGKKITAYNAHLGTIYVTKGQKVKQGDVIGTVSNTGTTASKTGPHLHFEMRENGNLIDPFTYIKRTASYDESQITKLASILENHYMI